MRKQHLLLLACAILCSSPSANALKIQLDYTYDTNNFFDQAGSKAALRSVADIFEKLITDELSEIKMADWPNNNTWSNNFRHPGTGNPFTIDDLDIPANTVIIYAGGRILSGGITGQAGPAGFGASGSQSFLNLIRSRGQAGALGNANQQTDFSLRTGSVTFDLDRSWNFTFNNTGGTEFISTALHEFCHIFGIGTSSSWNNLVSGSNFTGTISTISFGSNVPLHTDLSHWRNNSSCSGPLGYDPDDPNNILSRKMGIFGQTHGEDQIAIMDPSRCDSGQNFEILTDLELSALADIGWEVAPIFNTQLITNSSNQPEVSWNTHSAFTYTVKRSSNLLNFTPITPATTGDGQLASFTDPSPLAGRGFYIVEVNSPSASSENLRKKLQNDQTIKHDHQEERILSCSCHAH